MNISRAFYKILHIDRNIDRFIMLSSFVNLFSNFTKFLLLLLITFHYNFTIGWNFIALHVK